MNYIEHLFINFTFENKDQNFVSFYSALLKEIEELKTNYQLKIKTIYIATSDFLFLSSEQLTSLLNLIKQFCSSDLIEYTFEIGYQTIATEQLAILKQFKINRLVWKVRTFSQQLLALLNPKFDSQMMKELIKSSFNFNYQNFSIDLEDNINQQTQTDIISDLKIALNLKAPHISYQSHSDYHNYQNKALITDFLTQHNYHNYEFFSFAKSKANYSQQTLAYLTLKNWYGLGPNATSFLSINNQKITISNSEINSKIAWSSEVTNLDQLSYYQLLLTQSLMLQEGFLLTEDFLAAKNAFEKNVTSLINQGYLQIESNHLKTTNQGWVLLNNVLIDIISPDKN